MSILLKEKEFLESYKGQAITEQNYYDLCHRRQEFINLLESDGLLPLLNLTYIHTKMEMKLLKLIQEVLFLYNLLINDVEIKLGTKENHIRYCDNRASQFIEEYVNDIRE